MRAAPSYMDRVAGLPGCDCAPGWAHRGPDAVRAATVDRSDNPTSPQRPPRPIPQTESTAGAGDLLAASSPIVAPPGQRAFWQSYKPFSYQYQMNRCQ